DHRRRLLHVLSLFRNHGHESLRAISYEPHSHRPPPFLLRSAVAKAKRDPAVGPLAAIAYGAFPQSPQVVLQTFVGTLHSAECRMRYGIVDLPRYLHRVWREVVKRRGEITIQQRIGHKKRGVRSHHSALRNLNSATGRAYGSSSTFQYASLMNLAQLAMGACGVA